MKVFILMFVLACCHGNSEGPANHLVLFKEHPDGGKVTKPTQFLITSNFKGQVTFEDASEFSLILNATAPSLEDLAIVKYNYTKAIDGAILLQLLNIPPLAADHTIALVAGIILVVTLLVLICAAPSSLYWLRYKHTKDKLNPDAVQAPLIQGDGGQLHSKGGPMVRMSPPTPPPQLPSAGEEGAENAHGKVQKKRKLKKKMPKDSSSTSSKDIITSDEESDGQSNRSPIKLYQSYKYKQPLPEQIVLPPTPEIGAPLASSEGITSESSSASTYDKNNKSGYSDRYDLLQRLGGPDPRRLRSGHVGSMGSSEESTTSSWSDIQTKDTLLNRRSNPPNMNPKQTICENGSPGLNGRQGVNRMKSGAALDDPIPGSSDSDHTLDKNYSSDSSTQVPVNAKKIFDIAKQTRFKIDGNIKYPSVESNDGSPVSPATNGPHCLATNSNIVKSQNIRPEKPPKPARALVPNHVNGSNVPQLTNAVKVDLTKRNSDVSASSDFSTLGSSSSVDTVIRAEELANKKDIDNKLSKRRSSSPPLPPPPPPITEAELLQSQPIEPNNPLSTNSNKDLPAAPRPEDDIDIWEKRNSAHFISGNSFESTGSSQSQDSSGTSPRRRLQRLERVTPLDDSMYIDQIVGKISDGKSSSPQHTGNHRGANHVGDKKLHMTTLALVTCVALITGVYTQLTNQDADNTTINIIIRAPPGIILKGSSVFFKKEAGSLNKKGVDPQSEIWLYEVHQPKAQSEQYSLCQLSGCSHTCDVISNECICPQGNILISGKQCQEINECEDTEQYVCDLESTCINTPGSYICKCKDGYVEVDGKCELRCDIPCRNGTFAPKSCVRRMGKPCKVCQPKCQESQFELSPCWEQGDRACKDLKTLGGAEFSSNAIVEDRTKVIDVHTGLKYASEDGKLHGQTLSLAREGSKLTIEIKIKQANLAPIFQAANHSAGNDNEVFQGDVLITQQYCPYPVPFKYQLSRILFKDVLMKADYYDCQNGLNKNERCGWFANPSEPCMTHKLFGNYPQFNSQKLSVVCTEPSQLTDVFGVSDHMVHKKTVFAEKSEGCTRSKENCDKCIQDCGRVLSNNRESPPCEVTTEMIDNGYSPRLQYCHNCCIKQNCTAKCNIFTVASCQPMRCIKSNVTEIILSPIFNNQRTQFTCHIEKQQSTMFEIVYSVLYNGRPINGKRVKVIKKHREDRGHFKYNFLQGYYESNVFAPVDLVRGDTVAQMMSAGHYDVTGKQLNSSSMSGKTLDVRPVTPFAMTLGTWKQQGCNSNVLERMIIPDDGTYMKQSPELDMSWHTTHQYRVLNKTATPFIYFNVNKNESILEPFFEKSTIKDDSTLLGSLTRNDSHWSIEVSGELKTCPGYISVKLFDPNYPDIALYNYDVGVMCPKKFTIKFGVPLGKSMGYDKRFLVVLNDSHRKLKLTIYRKAPPQAHNKDASERIRSSRSSSSVLRQDVSVNVAHPVLLVIGAIIIGLSCVLLIGYVKHAENPKVEGQHRFERRHLVVVAGYVTYRAFYSLCMTMTVLLLILCAVNRNQVYKLSQYYRYTDSVKALQDLEIEKLQDHLDQEINRQNLEANQTRYACQFHLQRLDDRLTKLVKEMALEDNIDDGEKITEAATQYTKHMVEKLTKDMTHFRDRFNTYAQNSAIRLLEDIKQSYRTIEGNHWLKAAHSMHEAIRDLRSGSGEETKPFMEWIGLEENLESMTADLTFKSFPMLTVDDILSPSTQDTPAKPPNNPSRDSTSLPTNKWFIYKNITRVPPQTRGIRSKGYMDKFPVALMTLVVFVVCVDIIW
ncbi:unnamed protein product, partial [Owenia fusiformis]